MPELPLPPLWLPRRQEDSHKGTYGRCLIVAGSRGMAGAASLSGTAALRVGTGLVTVAAPDNCVDVVAAWEPCYTTLGLVCANGQLLAPDAIAQIASHPADAVGFGPGMGISDSQVELARWFYAHREVPAVIDADGLNCLALSSADWKTHCGPRILTPHPGEFRRMLASPAAEVDQLRSQASSWAGEHGVVLVLKGHRTLVTDGVSCYENPTGNPGMATGGSGDVLTGVIAGLLAQGLPPFDAARLGVYLHGLAGDLSAQRIGPAGLLARDLLDDLPKALQRTSVAPRPRIGFLS
jgi:ADP-dependent NAD(P)H-hydrate dehydratase